MGPNDLLRANAYVNGSPVVALLCACVENKAGPPGSRTEEWVRKGGREVRADAPAHVQTWRHAGKQPGNTANTRQLEDRVYEH